MAVAAPQPNPQPNPPVQQQQSFWGKHHVAIITGLIGIAVVGGVFASLAFIPGAPLAALGTGTQCGIVGGAAIAGFAAGYTGAKIYQKFIASKELIALPEIELNNVVPDAPIQPPAPPAPKKSWFRRHPIITGLAVTALAVGSYCAYRYFTGSAPTTPLPGSAKPVPQPSKPTSKPDIRPTKPQNAMPICLPRPNPELHQPMCLPSEDPSLQTTMQSICSWASSWMSGEGSDKCLHPAKAQEIQQKGHDLMAKFGDQATPVLDPRFTPGALRLRGRGLLSATAARTEYLTIDADIGRIEMPIQEKCLPIALGAAQARINAAEYVRSRMKDQEEAARLYDRDFCKYGTRKRDISYFLGKSAVDGNVWETCKALMKSAAKTSVLYNWGAPVYSYFCEN